MIRVGSRLLALAGGVLLGSTLCTTPATAATVSPLPADVSVTVDAARTVTEVRWELPADAAPGDVVTVALPEHAGVAAGADWVASSGVVIGVLRLDDTGTAVIELSDAAADPANRRGEMLVRSVLDSPAPETESVASTADAVLRPGEEPGPFFGAADRSRGNKYGAWSDEGETRARWVLESPRGPWDVVDIVDRPGPGQRVDCDAGVRVRSTSETDPATGYLLNPVDIDADRVAVSCDETGVSVRVAPTVDEIVEVTVETVLDVASTEVSNTADFTAERSLPGESRRTVSFEPRIGVLPSPTPTVPPAVETPAPAPEPGLPERLAETGTDAVPAVVIGAVLLSAGAATVLHRRRTRRRA